MKRGYSREFRPHGDTGKRYMLDEIPAGLWSDVRAKCKHEGVSIRAIILRLLSHWIASTQVGGIDEASNILGTAPADENADAAATRAAATGTEARSLLKVRRAIRGDDHAVPEVSARDGRRR